MVSSSNPRRFKSVNKPATGLSTARAWSEAGFSAKETAQWVEVVADPAVAKSLRTLGFDEESADEQRPEGGGAAEAEGAELPTGFYL